MWSPAVLKTLSNTQVHRRYHFSVLPKGKRYASALTQRKPQGLTGKPNKIGMEGFTNWM